MRRTGFLVAKESRGKAHAADRKADRSRLPVRGRRRFADTTLARAGYWKPLGGCLSEPAAQAYYRPGTDRSRSKDLSLTRLRHSPYCDGMSRMDARSAMIDAAERIVAERGLAALTLRAVQTESGQANKSAAQYHFGSRQGLLEAVIENRMRSVDDARRVLLDSLTMPTSRDLVEALVQPFADATLRRDGSCYARFLAQAIFAPELGHLIDEHLRGDSFRTVWNRLVEISPLPRNITLLRMSSVMTLMLSALAAHEGRGVPRRTVDVIVTDLVDSCLALLDGPPSTGDRREAARA